MQVVLGGVDTCDAMIMIPGLSGMPPSFYSYLFLLFSSLLNSLVGSIAWFLGYSCLFFGCCVVRLASVLECVRGRMGTDTYRDVWVFVV